MSLPTHESYSESGVDWMGEIPEHWTLCTLRRLVVSTNAGEVIDRTFWGGDAELLYTCAVEPLQSDYEGFPESKRTRSNDLLLTRNGTPYVHKPIIGSIYTNVVQRITLDDELDRDFAAISIQNAADNLRGYGVSIESLNYEMWKALPVVIPPLDEQLALVSFLDVETSKIDALVSEQRRLIELLKEKRQAVISNAVTKGLIRNAAMKPSGIEWFGDVPQHWRVSKLRWYCDSIRDGTHNPPPRADGIHRLLSVRNIIDGRFVLRDDDRTMTPDAFAELQRSYTVESGDVLLAIVGGTTGKSAVATQLENVTVQRSVAIIRPNQKRLDSHFLNYWIRCDSLQGKIQETVLKYAAQPGIYLDDIAGLAVPIPPLSEQTEIVASLNAQAGELDPLIAEAERAIELLQERSTALISAAVTGKIDVRDHVLRKTA